MPIRPVPLPIQFAGGVSTKVDPKQVPQTKLLRLENATFIKQSTLAKRNGYRALSRLLTGDASSYGTPVGLAKRGSEMLLFDSERCYSYRPTADRWSDAGEVASIIATDVPIGRTGTNQTVPDHATNGAVTAAAWEDSRGGVWCSVVETASGRVLLRDTLLDAAGTAPRCVPCGTVIHILWARAATGDLRLALVNPTNPEATPVARTLTNDLSVTNASYDACIMGGNAAGFESVPVVLAWAQNGGGYRVGYLHPSGVLGSPVTGLPSVATWTDSISGPIAVTFDKASLTHVAVVWTNTTGGTGTASVRFHGASNLASAAYYTGALATFAEASGVYIRCACEFADANAAGEGILWWAVEGSGSREDLSVVQSGGVTTAGAVEKAVATLRGHGLLSRAFYDDGHVYATVGHPVKYFSYAAVVRISADNYGGTAGTMCFARLMAGQLPALGARKHVTSVQAVDPSAVFLSRQHSMCAGQKLQLSSTNGDQFAETGIRLSTLDFDSDISYQSAELGRGTYLSGACMSNYDGKRWAESDFHAAPDVAVGAAAIAAQGGVGTVANGTYGYRLVYEEVDAQGELHQGAVSAGYNVVVSGGGGTAAVTHALPTYRLTNKKHVRIGVFRSPVNQTGEPSAIPYYRVTNIDPSVITGNNRYVFNDATVDTVAFVDGIADADLITREPLYTNGAILSNDPAPISGACIAGGKSRLFWTDQGDTSLVRYSKEIGDDLALEAPNVQKLRVDPYGGPVVAIGVMDRAIYPFTETAVYVFGGPGPDLDGGATSQNAFSPIDRVTSAVGCKSPASICSSPVGIAFQSSKGIMLLGRDGQVEDIGADVYAYNDQLIVRATLLPDRHQIVFLTDAGSTLLYDYERKQWSIYTNHEGYDAVVIDGVYHYLRTDGRVFQETPGVYADDNAQIVIKVETAWIKLTGYLQGWQSILWAYFLGTRKSAHTLRMRYRIDYEEGYSAPIDMDVDANWDPAAYGDGPYGAGAYGGPGGPSTVYQRRVHLNRRCQAISFLMEDVEATDNRGASFELSELLLIGGILGPMFQPSAARTT